jgi:malonate transporter and related proteins
MVQALGLIIPIFAVIAMGWLAVQLKLLDSPSLAGLTGFAYWVALPSLLFASIAELDPGGAFAVAIIYLACCLVVYGFAVAVSSWFFRRPLGQSAMFGLNATYGNVIYLGTPLVSAAFGQQGLTLILVIIAVHSGILLPLATVLIELDSGKQGGANIVVRNSIVNLLKNPIMMSILLGFLWRLTGLGMPMPLHTLLTLLGRAASPLALFCLGATLPGISGGILVLREAILATTLKLLILPISVGVACWLVRLPDLSWHVAVLTAAMPTGANAILLARRATDFAEESATVVVLSTAVSVLTITVLLNWIGLPR